MATKFPDEMAHFAQVLDNASKPKGTLLEMSKYCELYPEMVERMNGDPPNTNFGKDINANASPTYEKICSSPKRVSYLKGNI